MTRKTPRRAHAEEEQPYENPSPGERDPPDKNTCGGSQRERTQRATEEAEPQDPEWRNPKTQDQRDPPERRRTRKAEEGYQHPEEPRDLEEDATKAQGWTWSQTEPSGAEAVPRGADAEARGAEADTEGAEPKPTEEDSETAKGRQSEGEATGTAGAATGTAGAATEP